MKPILIVLGYFSLQTNVRGMNSTGSESQSQLCDTQGIKFYTNFGTISKSRFCLNETYLPGHAVGKLQEECLVEPENVDLSFPDSAWTYYKCIVTKSLGSTPLTLTSYAEMMTGNLSATTKSAILSFINETHNQDRSAKTNLERENLNANFSASLELHNLEKYWNAYFDAEYHVCTNLSLNPCADKMLQLKKLWAPSQRCRERNVPFIGILDVPYSYSNYLNCTSSIANRHVSTIETKHEIQDAASAWCMSVLYGLVLEEQDENKNVDFATYYNKLIMPPSFYSKRVQREQFLQIRKKFSRTYFKHNETILESESVKDILTYAIQHLQVQLVEEGHAQENLVFLTNGNVMDALLQYMFALVYHLCNPDQK